MPSLPARRLRSKYRSFFKGITNRFTANSSRRVAKILAAVVHTTQSRNLDGVVSWFMNRGSSASSHYVVDEFPRQGEYFTRVVRMVPEKPRYAWTQRSANPVCISYELVGFAEKSRDQWLDTHVPQLRTLALLVAEDCLQYGIPAKHTYPGVLGHGDLDGHGFPNDHWDPGPGFPWAFFMGLVRGYMADGRGRPPVEREEQVKRRKRPGPRRIPRWAWQYHKYLLTPPKERGRRPRDIPRRVPPWFWEWRKWRLGLTEH